VADDIIFSDGRMIFIGKYANFCSDIQFGVSRYERRHLMEVWRVGKSTSEEPKSAYHVVPCAIRIKISAVLTDI
jgi:predicted fused transcriptional regulator/phosphomethylpyrimidine kinase